MHTSTLYICMQISTCFNCVQRYIREEQFWYVQICVRSKYLTSEKSFIYIFIIYASKHCQTKMFGVATFHEILEEMGTVTNFINFPAFCPYIQKFRTLTVKQSFLLCISKWLFKSRICKLSVGFIRQKN